MCKGNEQSSDSVHLLRQNKNRCLPTVQALHVHLAVGGSTRSGVSRGLRCSTNCLALQAVERPRYKIYGGNSKKRETPRTAFLVPDRHLSHKDFGRILIDAGVNIILGNEENSVAICTTAEQYYRAIFGEDEKKEATKKKKEVTWDFDDAETVLLSIDSKGVKYVEMPTKEDEAKADEPKPTDVVVLPENLQRIRDRFLPQTGMEEEKKMKDRGRHSFRL